MKTLISIIAFFFISYSSFAQNCKCTKDNIAGKEKPEKVYKFSNGKYIGLCGTAETNNKEKNYTEFEIHTCGADTSILVIEATQTCSIDQIKDTLLIQEYFDIANGKNLSGKWTRFYVTKIYWKGKKIVKENYFKKDLKKYTKAEIDKVLKDYITTEKSTNFDKILLLGHRLFWAYVSGSKKAGKYLDNFYKKYEVFDGAISEEYSDIIETYELYKTMNK